MINVNEMSSPNNPGTPEMFAVQGPVSLVFGPPLLSTPLEVLFNSVLGGEFNFLECLRIASTEKWVCLFQPHKSMIVSHRVVKILKMVLVVNYTYFKSDNSSLTSILAVFSLGDLKSKQQAGETFARASDEQRCHEGGGS